MIAIDQLGLRLLNNLPIRRRRPAPGSLLVAAGNVTLMSVFNLLGRRGRRVDSDITYQLQRQQQQQQQPHAVKRLML
jgi:ribose 1,5-bisphosphokinase PhnN